ncbi:type II toxin-antitoxin system Phd/YefM family antitoxin [Photobacterium sanctipauli]|uniref:Antitoxin n=1 Tax=Photobacterium sanctipauli TaxID=1342794 RepID=A0A2T3NMW9_9GAMM|nr:type II toxin-antitoxin system Phd/YefM family antitoxin [Photobacterium sanctipauli]PSW16851.1 type II toxin-antitoxin system Phd/YefM family antitoxin [Photobacterium sanctipauli]
MKVEVVTTLKREMTKVLAELHDSKETVLIKEHGKPSAYPVDVDAYDFMQTRIAILEGIVRGEKLFIDDAESVEESCKETSSHC